ncbi:phospholipase-like protein [Tanacetum coccineum]
MPHTIYTGLLGHSSYLNIKKWWSKKANVIPRGLAWSEVTKFKKSDYDCLFGSLSNPNVALISSPEEMRQAWFMVSVDFIKGLVDQDGKFLQDEEARSKRGDGVLDSEGDGVHLSQTNDVIQQAHPSSSFSHPGNDKDASHLDDLMKIDGENVKDGYTNSQHHLRLFIKVLESKTKNPTLDVVVPPKDDDCILRTIKPNDAYDVVEDFSGQPRIRSINHIMTHEPFVENLSRPDDYKSDKVTVPEHMCEFITNKALPEYQFPWGKRDIVIGHSFELSLSCRNTGKAGWLNDHVYFLINEPKTHWCLAELEIHTGVVTFYDSLGWAGGSRRRWWRRMKKLLPKKLTVYLVMHGIFKGKGISADDYKIKYKYVGSLIHTNMYRSEEI